MTSTPTPAPYVYADRQPDLDGAVAAMRAAPVVAVDTEADSRHRYPEKLCLVQLSDGERVFLVDTLADLDFGGLCAVLEDPRIEKTLHGADFDVRGINRDLGACAAPCYDTHIAAKFLGLDRLSLSGLLEDVLGVAIPKNQSLQRSDWSKRPLPPDALDYAAADVAHLVALSGAVKERVRALLDRYGILFRELLKRELPHFQWGAVFRALRIMELAGEVYAGAFFHGIPGLQFISKRAFERLKAPLNEDAVYWLNAADPASLCGLQLEAARGLLPRREPSAHLTYHGARLVLESRRQGKALKIHVPPDDERLDRYLAPIERLLTRPAQPLPRIVVETVNGVQASKSPYVEALRRRFDAAVEYETVALHRKYE